MVGYEEPHRVCPRKCSCVRGVSNRLYILLGRFEVVHFSKDVAPERFLVPGYVGWQAVVPGIDCLCSPSLP